MSDYKALYRKWRPADFDDVCGQRAITDILKYEVSNNKISHAYLFCGSRGTGKTSCAKILAKAVNCLEPRNGNPCNRCQACRSIDTGTSTDVIEMDAASNNGVDNVRILKDEISFTPALLKYRVYIIDEVHMMSTQAFNALLKTLEEPPSYVVFILATTEYNKLPTTIVSRCQRFDFRRMTSEVIINRLARISESEGIDLSEDGARLIARAARGGMRDAVSLLELCAGSREKIDARLVYETLGTGDRGAVYELVDAVGRSDFSAVYSVIDRIIAGSADVSVFWQEIIDTYRDIMVVKNSANARLYLDLTETEYETLCNMEKRFTMPMLSYHTTLLEAALADMQRSVNSKRSIAEIALTRMCDARQIPSPEALTVRIEELERQLYMIKMGVVSVKNEQEKPKAEQSSQATVSKEGKCTAVMHKSAETDSASYSNWADVLERIAEIKPQLASGLRRSEVVRVADEFVFKMDEFFVSRLEKNEADMALLRGAIAEREGKTNESIRIRLEKFAKADGGYSYEIENALKF